MSDLADGQKSFKYAKATATAGVMLNHIDLKDALLAPYGDGAWANALGSATGWSTCRVDGVLRASRRVTC